MKIFSTLHQFAQQQQTTIQINKNDLGLPNGPTQIGEPQVQAILGTVYVIAGIVAVLAIIIGSIRFMAANGEAAKVSTAKNVISYAVVGLVVILMAAALTNWVIGQVG